MSYDYSSSGEHFHSTEAALLIQTRIASDQVSGKIILTIVLLVAAHDSGRVLCFLLCLRSRSLQQNRKRRLLQHPEKYSLCYGWSCKELS